jgi:outer membrane protein TolC
MKNRFLYICIFLSCLFLIYSTASAQSEFKTLNSEQVLQLVKLYHPIARQAQIGVEKAQADIVIARGAFDPIINSYLSRKSFDGKDYYTYSNLEIKIPAWYGIEVYSGIESLSGARVDNSSTLGQTNFLGISIPLAKNLVLDKRRAYLQQARIFKTLAKVEQRSTINDLLMGSMEAYWQWVRAYQTYLVMKNNVEVNQKRLELVKKSFDNGERPAIDTTEASTQLMSFQYQQNAYWLEFQNAGLQLSAYLWKSNDEPYNLPESIIPQDGWEIETNILQFNLELTNLLNTAITMHPELQVYENKLDILTIEKRLKFQELLPKIDFRYNLLGKGYNVFRTPVESQLFENNFQYGLKLEVPLLFSNGRGQYRQAKLKIEETRLDQNQKLLSVQLKVRSYYNEFVNLQNQIALQSRNYESYLQLVRAEQSRFEHGESSLFMINSRENKALEAYEKLIELKTKYFKTIYSLQWSAGLLI